MTSSDQHRHRADKSVMMTTVGWVIKSEIFVHDTSQTTNNIDTFLLIGDKKTKPGTNIQTKLSDRTPDMQTTIT